MSQNDLLNDRAAPAVPPIPNGREETSIELPEIPSVEVETPEVPPIPAPPAPEIPVVEEPAETAVAPPPAAEEPEFDTLRTVTTLLIGLGLEGTRELAERLQRYEEELAAGEQVVTDGETTTEDQLRYALIGFILDTQSRVRRSASLFTRFVDVAIGVSASAARPIRESRFGRPVQRRYDELVSYGEETVRRWIATGREVEPQSRQLARRTANGIIDEFIERLAENPEVQLLVQQQSIGLATEIRDEVRERTVTADNALESIVRRVLRRAPRAELPEPPLEVRQQAGRPPR